MNNSTIIDLTAIAPNKVAITPTGLVFNEPITLEEWTLLGDQIGKVEKAVQWLIGDWLVYGEDKFKRVETQRYDAIVASTGIERHTLHNYAYTARKVPSSLRKEHLGFHHHQAVAKFKSDEEKSEWLDLAEKHRIKKMPITIRRFRRSIECGKLLSDEDLQIEPTDKGTDNHHPWLSGLTTWWRNTRSADWFANADAQQIEFMIRDFRIVADILQTLHEKHKSLRNSESKPSSKQ